MLHPQIAEQVVHEEGGPDESLKDADESGPEGRCELNIINSRADDT